MLTAATMQWINTSAEEDDTSLSAKKRAVRTQAMKHHRNRQRLERQQNHKGEMLHQVRVRQRDIPGLDVSVIDRIEDRSAHVVAADGFASSSRNGTVPGTCRHTSAVQSVLDAMTPIDSASAHQQGETRRNVGRSRHGQAPGILSYIPKGPSTWGEETLEPFSSPAQVGRMFKICKTCMTANILPGQQLTLHYSGEEDAT